jgi:prevent-host-death family protein
MIKSSISQTKNQLSALIDQVRQGETVLITDHDRPVAKLSAIESSDTLGIVGALERKGVIRRGTGRLCSISAPLRPKDNASAVAMLLEDREQGR